jgi:hypothetical protein
MSLIAATMFSLHSTESAARLGPVFLDAPTNLGVTATSSASVTLSWTAPAGAVDHYEVLRSDTISGSFVVVGNAAGTSFNDTTVTNLRAYLYTVRAVASGGITSASSNLALGTAISFQFSVLQGNPIRAQHFHDVRTAINAVRTAANLPAATWTRANLSGLDIRATDVQEMRDKLGEALTALAIAVPAYTDPVLSTGPGGTLIRGVHVEQLQARSTRGSSTTTPNPNPSPTPCSTSLNPSVVGRFDPNVISLPLVPVHISVLPDGRVLFWGRDRDVASDGTVKEVAGKSEAYVWNISEGSNKTDVAVFRPSENKWYIINSSTGASRVVSLGSMGDVPAPGDYDGDGKADLAVFSPNAFWTIVNSSDGSVRNQSFGIQGDVPVPGDYDQDGKTDLAIYRPSNGLWGIFNSKDGSVTAIGWGIPGDKPVPGDYDRDRRNDLAVYRPSEGTWYIRKSSTTATLIRQWGNSGDVPAPGDYNGDAATDPAVYRPSDGNYYVGNIMVPEFSQALPLGQAPSATVVSGDFDGDGKTDPAIFRPSEGNWQIRDSSTGLIELRSWGQNGDVPVPKDYDGMLRVANTTTNVFCSGHSFLPDGRLFVSGGHRSPDFDAAGEPYTNIFDYRTNCWTRGPNLNHGRWYPYNVELSTGETLIMGGSYWSNEPTKPPNLVRNLDVEIYNGGTTIPRIDSPGQVTSYPYLHLIPDGRILQVQSGFTETASRLLNTTATAGNQWQPWGSTTSAHFSGSAVSFDSGKKVLVVGGFNALGNPTQDAEFLGVDPLQSTWTTTTSMNFPRAYHTATILPNGKVLVTGGVICQGSNHVDCGQVLNAEMWDPTANPNNLAQTPWCKMAAYKEVRAYHSIAVLLPDGKVLVGGGGLPGAVGEVDANGVPVTMIDTDNNGQPDTFTDSSRFYGHKNVEIYSPPYLFNADGSLATQPLITSAPASISYGQTFFVGTSGAGTTPKVSLVRLASVTHGFNQDQRQLSLADPQVVSGGMNVTAPADPKVCPPGYYMLFVLNNGVPSVAKIVKVQSGQTTSFFPTDVPTTTASGQGSTFEQGLEFSSSVNGQITHIRFWKALGEPAGNHFARIWNNTGTQQFVSVPFGCESAFGWQEVQLPTPFQVTAGVRYRVTYNIQSFGSKTFNVLDTPITRGNLTGWSSYFSSPAGSFPTTPSGSNLFVDIIFKTP